tara:strand:- start:187 stop:360 length:174 start_codon:yes stop_codon:yes gene_type:complete
VSLVRFQVEPPLKIRPHGVYSVEAFLLGHGRVMFQKAEPSTNDLTSSVTAIAETTRC